MDVKTNLTHDSAAARALGNDWLVTEVRLPQALRATRLRGRWPFGRPSFRYDVLFGDGSLVTGVSADRVLQGHLLPADAWATREAAQQVAGDGEPGVWVEYATGRRPNGL